jgi:pimeloyl-ACP methyl ester carboxylesterase
MASWTDGYWWSNDGLRLHYRDYPGGSEERPPILCIHGLTRNARDFEGVADRLAGAWRVICVDLRGRGESAYAEDPMTYVPLVYLQDLEALLRELGLKRFVGFGTSLGGIMMMLLAMGGRERIAAVLLNDVGPELNAAGLDRIRSYVGRAQNWPTWLHAARFFAQEQGHIYPRWDTDQWLVHTKRLCRLNAQGRVIRDYDMRIAEPFRAPRGEVGLDLWPAFAAIDCLPALVIHGETSDILSAETLEAMHKANPGLASVTITGVGHAPTLEEPEAVAAIDRLLARVGAGS